MILSFFFLSVALECDLVRKCYTLYTNNSKEKVTLRCCSEHVATKRLISCLLATLCDLGQSEIASSLHSNLEIRLPHVEIIKNCPFLFGVNKGYLIV